MFQDRTDAGRALAARLGHLRDEGPLVLALPRGGVPVALEIARALGAPLDLMLVRKIGAPSQPELAVGAVAEGDQPEIVANPYFAGSDIIASDWFREEALRQIQEIGRRRTSYLEGRARPELRDRTVILVDDGIATGSTMEVAILAARRAGPRRLVLAVPVAAADSLERLAPLVDESVCPLAPTDFAAVGQYYRDFRQLEDVEVCMMLRDSAGGSA